MRKPLLIQIVPTLGGGGAEKEVARVSRVLNVRSPFRVAVCCIMGRGEFADAVEEAGVEVIVCHESKRSVPTMAFDLWRLLRKSKPAIAHCHLVRWATLVAKLAGVPVVISSQHSWLLRGNWFDHLLDKMSTHFADKVVGVSKAVTQHRLKLWRYTRQWRCIRQALIASAADRLARRRAGGLLVVSKPSYNLYLRRGVAPERLLLARNGADLNRFAKLPFRPDDGILRICYSGSFVPWQGIENLVQACKILLRRGWPERLRLRVIGFSSEDAEVRSTLSDLLGSRFEPLDRVPHAEVPRLFADVDMMLIPRVAHSALRVAMPTKFAEYLASGRPVIVSDVDETSEIVREAGLGLVAEPSPGGLADALECASDLPREAIVEMGSKAREVAEREFSWDKIAGDYYTFLKGLIRP